MAFQLSRIALCSVFACFGSLALAGCGHPAVTARQSKDFSIVNAARETPGIPEPGQKLFASPEEAAATLKDAVLTQDKPQLIAIFGPDGRQLVLTGDRVEEKNDLNAFGSHLSEYLSIQRPTPTLAILHIGRENWPFPIPLAKSGDQWFFDTVAGKDELLNRRIGENELNAIAVCRAFVVAEKEYARQDRTGDKITQYAQKFRSNEGKHDGLYWPAASGEPLSPMGPLVAEAHAEGYGQHPPDGRPHPFHGYYFHILTAQGDAAPGGRMSYIVDGHMTKGFALIASPSAWGSSGIMSFLVSLDGKVYEKNLGKDYDPKVNFITEYNPDKSWEPVKD